MNIDRNILFFTYQPPQPSTQKSIFQKDAMAFIPILQATLKHERHGFLLGTHIHTFTSTERACRTVEVIRWGVAVRYLRITEMFGCQSLRCRMIIVNKHYRCNKQQQRNYSTYNVNTHQFEWRLNIHTYRLSRYNSFKPSWPKQHEPLIAQRLG